MTVLTAAAAKGLEVDTVVLVEPAAILDESPLGAHDLYVAMTRCTQRLRVLHSAPRCRSCGSAEPHRRGR